MLFLRFARCQLDGAFPQHFSAIDCALVVCSPLFLGINQSASWARPPATCHFCNTMTVVLVKPFLASRCRTSYSSLLFSPSVSSPSLLRQYNSPTGSVRGSAHRIPAACQRYTRRHWSQRSTLNTILECNYLPTLDPSEPLVFNRRRISTARVFPRHTYMPHTHRST